MANCHYFLPKTLAISKIAYIKHGRTTMLHAQAINAELFPIIAKTRQAINKAYSAHRKDHERLLKSHLAEEMRQIKKAKAKLD